MKGQTLEYLDRHSMDCGSAKLLGSFKVTDSGCSGNNMRFEYTCIDVGSYHGAVASRSTGCSEMKFQKLQNLDRHNVQCNTGEALVSFRVTDSGCGGNDMKVAFECVTTPTPSPTPSPTLSPTPSPTSAPGARGDPHLTSVSGKKFDVNQPGGYTLLRVPLDRSLPAKLELKASLEAAHGSPCGLYIHEAQLSGLWLGDSTVTVRPLRRNMPGSNGAGDKLLRPFTLEVENRATGKIAVDQWGELAKGLSGRVRVKTVWRKSYADAKKMTEAEAFQFTIECESPHSTDCASVQVSQASHQALDVEVAGLQGLGFEQIGGLLGTESHDAQIEQFTPACATLKATASKGKGRLSSDWYEGSISSASW
jgi:hypothetical protein